MRYTFKTKPMKHQAKALKFLAKNKGVGALLMDPGTGKTKVVIDYIGAYAAKWGSVTVLITAPLSALDTWVDEFRKHLGTWEGEEIPCEILVLDGGSILEKAEAIAQMERPESGIRAVVINHDAFKYTHLVPGLKTVTVRDRILKAVSKFQPDILVVDEMHRAKSHTSNLNKSLVKISDHTFHRIGMTGTVAPHSPLDFFGQWLIINPNVFGRKFQTFKYYYAIFGGFEGREIIGFYRDRLKEMRHKRRADSIVVKKRDALDLPKVSDIIVNVTLQEEADTYLKMGRDLIAELPSGKKSISQHTITKILRLRQITGGNLGYKEIETDPKTNKVVEVSRSEEVGSSKLRALSGQVIKIADAGKKQVVFAHFREDCRRIVEHLEKDLKANGLKHVPVFLITGDTKNTSRVKKRKEFYSHEGAAVFVAQMRTVSLAVNEFVVASYGHFFSYSQLRDDYEQARDRLDRNGQTEPVTFYHYIVPNSVDAVIYQSHKEKRKLEEVVTKRAKELLTLGAG